MKKGFTLIEIFIVLCIIGIIAAIVIGSVNGCKRKTPDPRVSDNDRFASRDAETIVLGQHIWIDTKTVDGCEYIVVVPRGIGGVAIIHKANCKNHR